MGKKKTGGQKASRVEEVYQLLCTGLNRQNLLEYAAGQEWEESPEQIDELIAEATIRLTEAAAVSLDAEMGKSIERLNKLFMDSLKVQDHKTALSVQKEINRMLQLKAKTAEKSRPTIRKLRIVN